MAARPPQNVSYTTTQLWSIQFTGPYDLYYNGKVAHVTCRKIKRRCQEGENACILTILVLQAPLVHFSLST